MLIHNLCIYGAKRVSGTAETSDACGTCLDQRKLIAAVMAKILISWRLTAAAADPHRSHSRGGPDRLGLIARIGPMVPPGQDVVLGGHRKQVANEWWMEAASVVALPPTAVGWSPCFRLTGATNWVETDEGESAPKCTLREQGVTH